MDGIRQTLRSTAMLTALACLVASIVAAPLMAAPTPKKDTDSVIVEKNLFRTDRKPPPPPKFKLVVKRPVRGLKYVKLEGVIALGGKMRALVQAPFMFLDDESSQKGLDYVWVKVGEKLGGFTVTSIDNGQLVMEKDGKVHTIKLGDDGKKKDKQDKKPLFSKRAQRFRKPGSLFLVYASDGTLVAEGEIPELGAPDLVPTSRYPVGGRIDIVADVTDPATEDTSDEDDIDSANTEKKTSSSSPWSHSGWQQVAAIDPAPTFTPAESAAEPVPVTQIIEIVEQMDEVVEVKPEAIVEEEQQSQEKDINPCLDAVCDPVTTPAFKWNEACCGPHPDPVMPDDDDDDDDDDDVDPGEWEAADDDDDDPCWPPWNASPECVSTVQLEDPVVRPE